MKATLSNIDSRIVVKENRTDGILGYDIDNVYPQRMEYITGNSGTAMSCLRILTKFIIGGGMTDLTFYKAKVNRFGLTVDKLLRKSAKDKAKFNAFAWHVNYNALFEVVEVIPVKYVDVRIKIDKTQAALHPDWEKKETGKNKFNKKDIQFIDWWDPTPEAIQVQVDAAGGWENYKGQIYYATEVGIEYSIAIYDSVLEDMETEGQMKKVRFRATAQNFLASQILLTDEAETEEEAEEFADTIRDFQGADNTGAVLILEKKAPTDTFELHKVDLQDYDGMHEKTEGSVKDNIVEIFTIPKPLLLRGTASIGKSDEIEDAKAYYNDVTADDRLVFEEAFREVFGRWADTGVPINPSDDYSIIPVRVKKKFAPEYFPYFTKNEIRVSCDEPEAPEAKADTKLLVETLGVGGTQALIAVLIDPALDEEQKKGTLKVVFGLNEEQAVQLLAKQKTIR